MLSEKKVIVDGNGNVNVAVPASLVLGNQRSEVAHTVQHHNVCRRLLHPEGLFSRLTVPVPTVTTEFGTKERP